MTWTYTPDFDTDRDQVRFFMGDTDTTDQLISDEEIAFAVTEEGNLYEAAATLCEALAAEFARKVNRQVGDLRLSSEQQFEHYLELAGKLRRRASTKSTNVLAPSISIADKNAAENDTDRVRPSFTRDLHKGVDTWPIGKVSNDA